MMTWNQLLSIALLPLWDMIRYRRKADPFAILLIIVAIHDQMMKANHNKSAKAYEQNGEEEVLSAVLLKKKGVVCLSKEWIIFFPYNQDPNVIKQISCLCHEFHFHVQLEI